MHFEFNKLFPKNEEVSFEFNSVTELKKLDFYNLLKNEKEVIKKCKSLRTMANIIKADNMTTFLLFWLNKGLENQLDFLEKEELIEYFKEVFNLLMYGKFAFECRRNNPTDKKLGERLCRIVIGKLSTIINLVEYDKDNKYRMKTIDNEPIENIERQIELFKEDELDVNNIQLDKIK